MLYDIMIDCPVLSGVVTTSTVACSLGNGTIPVVLNNTSSNISGFFTVSYATSTDSGSTFSSYTTLAVTEVAKETTDNSTLSISGISHNTVVRIKYTVANASEGLTQAETTISPDITIDCPYTNVVVTGSTIFQRYNGSSTAETMRLTETGFVGIGTNSPTEKLHVYNYHQKPPIFKENWNKEMLMSRR